MLYSPTAGRGEGVLTLAVDGERVLVSTRVVDGPIAIVYFGGNAEEVSYNLPDFKRVFPEHSLYLMHYRGYSGSSGTPTESGLVRDGLALFDRVRGLHSRVAVIGRSLGSGIAVRVAGEREVAALALVTPYESIEDVAGRHFPWLPVRWLLRDKYLSWKYAPAVKVLVTVLAAEHDDVIPRASTDLLLTRFRKGQVKFAVIPGTDHNSISESEEYWARLRDGLR